LYECVRLFPLGFPFCLTGIPLGFLNGEDSFFA
jgi:hypothetical protein